MGQNPGEALDLDPSLGPSSICSLVTRSRELSRHLFSYGPECAESLSASCSPSRGLQCSCSSGWFLGSSSWQRTSPSSGVLTVPDCPSRWHRACGGPRKS